MKKELLTPIAPSCVSITGNGTCTAIGNSGNVIINDTAIILRLLSIIESQGKEIARLHDELIRLRITAIQNKISHE